MYRFLHRRTRGLSLLSGSALLLLCAACGDSATGTSKDVASLAVVSAPDLALLGVPFTTLPVVELRDDAGQPLLSSGVAITASVSSGTLSGTTSVLTDAQGRAKFTDLAVDGSAGQTELRFSCCGLTPAVRTLSLILGEASIERIDPEVITGLAGETLNPGPSVRVMDERHKVRTGAEVRFEFEGTVALPPVSVTSDGNGIATLPAFQLADLPSSTNVRAVDVASGKSVHFALVTTVRGNAYTLDKTFAAVGMGGSVALPRVRVTDGEPVADAIVRYRVASGDGVLSETEVHTGTDGWTGPVTLTTSGRGKTVVEAVAVGYSLAPIATSVVAISPPLVLEYAGPCTTGCPSSLDFTVSFADEASWGTYVPFQIRVRDAGGTVADYQLDLSAVSAGTSFWADAGPLPYTIPDEAPAVTGADGVVSFNWSLPHSLGSFGFTIGGPMISSPWTYTATVE
jgi:hypothetical protein